MVVMEMKPNFDNVWFCFLMNFKVRGVWQQVSQWGRVKRGRACRPKAAPVAVVLFFFLAAVNCCYPKCWNRRKDSPWLHFSERVVTIPPACRGRTLGDLMATNSVQWDMHMNSVWRFSLKRQASVNFPFAFGPWINVSTWNVDICASKFVHPVT